MRFLRIMIALCFLTAGTLTAVSPTVAFAETGTPANKPTQACRQYFLDIDFPDSLTQEQRHRALEIINTANPRLVTLHTELTQTLQQLRNLSFAAETPPDALEALGRKLVSLRNDIMTELQQVSQSLETQAGFNPGWGQRRTCALQGMAPRPERTRSTAAQIRAHELSVE